jgi:hypothetical protein
VIRVRMKSWTPLAALGLAAVVAACGESLDSGPICPTLCPGPVVDLRETILEPVVLDTVIGGLPPVGGEPFLLLAEDPGVVVTFGVVRFDTLFTHYIVVNGDARDTLPVTALDSAYLRLGLDTATMSATQPITFELYDVSAAAGDTVTANIVAIVESSAPFADTTIAPTSLGDSLRIEIPKEFLQAKVTAAQGDPTTPLRIAIRATSAEPVQIRIRATNLGSALQPLLIYDPVPADTAIHPHVISPYSKTPAGAQPELLARLRDFTVYAVPTPDPGAGALAVGGLPGRRSLFRFEIPSEIIDSTTIVRATLILYPTGVGVGDDSLGIITQYGTAGPVIDDPRRQALLAVDALSSVLFVDTVKVLPGSTDSATVDIVNVVTRLWTSVGVDTLPRVLVLRSADEGSRPEQVVFYSSEAADPALRPRLRIRYIPAVDFGLP